MDISAGSVRLGINCPPVFCNPSDLRRFNKSMSTKSRKLQKLGAKRYRNMQTERAEPGDLHSEKNINVVRC